MRGRTNPTGRRHRSLLRYGRSRAAHCSCVRHSCVRRSPYPSRSCRRTCAQAHHAAHCRERHQTPHPLCAAPPMRRTRGPGHRRTVGRVSTRAHRSDPNPNRANRPTGGRGGTDSLSHCGSSASCDRPKWPPRRPTWRQRRPESPGRIRCTRRSRRPCWRRWRCRRRWDAPAAPVSAGARMRGGPAVRWSGGLVRSWPGPSLRYLACSLW